MSYKLIKNLIKPGIKRPGGRFEKTTITIHSTANPKSTAENERAWIDNPQNTRAAAWHYVVGEGIVIQAIPDEELAPHCGNDVGNNYSIGIEIIESGDRIKVLNTAALFVSDKLKELGLTVKDLRRHCDWANKDCPRILINNAYIKDNLNWNWFIKTVEAYMNEGKADRYNTIDELPEWARPTIQELVNRKAIADGNKLDLSMDMVRVLVIVNRS